MKKIYIAPLVEEMPLKLTGVIMTSIPDPFAPAPPRRRGDVIE